MKFEHRQSIVEWQEEALRDYVKERMAPQQFAEHVGMEVHSVYAVLRGKSWTHARRPEGFCYPWPEQAPEAVHRQKEEALRDYVRERMTPSQFAERAGINVETAYCILQGRAWPRVLRPEGFEYPWPERERKPSRLHTKEEIDAAFLLREAQGWTRRQLAEHMGVHPTTISNWIKQHPDRERLRNGITDAEAKTALGNLITLIHGDGGRAIQQRGWKQAVREAEAIVVENCHRRLTSVCATQGASGE